MRQVQKFETSRLAGFSDAVFAICITLLVLELKIPDGPGDDLLTALQSIAPKLEAWALSYLVIGSLWVLQHNIFAQLRYADTVLLWLNLLFLMCISLMPWTTDLVGFYLREPLAVALFSGSLGIAGLLLMAAWAYAVHRGRLSSPHVDAHTARVITLLAARIPVVAAISIALAFVHRSLALWSWLLVLALGLAVRSLGRTRARDERAPSDV